MSHSIVAVQSERKRCNRLKKKLDSNWKTTKRGCQGSRFQVQSQDRSDKIGNRKEIQTTRQGNSSYTVSTAEIPGDLGTVDGDVRRNRTIQALLFEQLGRIIARCSDISIMNLSVSADIDQWLKEVGV